MSRIEAEENPHHGRRAQRDRRDERIDGDGELPQRFNPHRSAETERQTNAAADQAVVPNAPQAWGPQVYKGNVFVSDMNSGLWVIKHARPRPVTF